VNDATSSHSPLIIECPRTPGGNADDGDEVLSAGLKSVARGRCLACKTTTRSISSDTPPMSEPDGERREEHLDASEDDGSAQLQPEDGGTAEAPRNKPGTQRD
jgi:hypothetical protein